MILAKDKSIGLTIEDNAGSMGKRKTFDGILIFFGKKSFPLLSTIYFKNEEFFRFCALLEKTKSDATLQELRKIFLQILKSYSDGIDYYGGISYLGDKPKLSYGITTKKIIGTSEAAKVKRTYIHRSFGIVSMGSDKYEVNKIKKTIGKVVVSNTPSVSISLERNAFMKFRLACLRAVVRLKNRN